MKKKILIVINNFVTGGIQKSLVELLPLICDKYDVTVYASRLTGFYVEQIPDNVKVVVGSKFAQMTEYPRWEYRRVGGLVNYLLKLLLGWLSTKMGRRIPVRIYCFLLGKIPGKYDVAISYGHSLGDYSFHNLENEITLYCTRAKRKVTFIHCDYEQYGGNTVYNHSLLRKFDSIAAVSYGVADKFCSLLPNLTDKLYVVYNACDYSFIKEQANVDSVIYEKKCIVSVCRLSPVKGLLRCVPIIKKLLDDGYSFEWHIVGGGDEDYSIKLQKIITKNNLQNVVFLEGEQSNPYRFLKNANFLFLPSYHEAAPMVFNEACCLGIPVLTTNTLSAKEMVSSRNVGFVCDNNDTGIYNMLKQAIGGNIPPIDEVDMRAWNNVVVEQFTQLIS